MAGLSSPGIGSGLDINGLITRLMELEKRPLVDLNKKEVDYQSKLTAYGTLKGAFSSFQGAVKGLTSTSKFGTSSASASDKTILSASASNIAKAGKYSIEISQLAQQHKLATQTSFEDTATTIGTGTLQIDFGSYDGDGNTFTANGDSTSLSIEIDSQNNSLAGIRDAINEKDGGVTASIINDGDGYRLVLSSENSGADNSLRILISDDGDSDDSNDAGLSQLAYDPTASVGSGKNLEQTLAAKNAELTIDGIAISKADNRIDDAIPGVTLRLEKVTESGSPVTLNVARDTGGVKTAVEGFVKSFNDLAATIKDLGGYDFKTKKGGLLLGDSTLRGMQSQVRSIISTRLQHSGNGVSTLSEIGVSFQRDGTLKLDSSKLSKVLADPEKNVASLFAEMGVPSDSLVTYASASKNTQTGVYGVDITQAASRGSSTGSTALGASTVITTANQKLTVNLNGLSATVTLNTGSYTAEELVSELQLRINSDSSYQKKQYSVSVAQSGGILSLTSTLYGSSSKIEVTGGSAASTLFGSTSSTSGVDVAGTIGGSSAEGKGQYLTGTAAASGLKLLIEGSGTGARGTVSFSRGVAWQLDKALGSLLGEDGTLTSRTDGIDRSIESIGRQREILNRRLEETEKRYRAQYTKLDSLLASMQNTANALSSQLAGLSSNKSK